MKNHTNSLTALTLAIGLMAAGSAGAQVAGSATSVGVTVTTDTQIAAGWSVKKSLMGKTVYNDSGAKVGKVDDLIIDPDKSVSYLIIAAGGFAGIGRHDVAVAASAVKQQDGRLVMPGATRDMVKAMPEFHYATDTTQRDQFMLRADRDIARARAGVERLEQRASSATDAGKVRMNSDIAEIKVDMKSAEDKLAGLRAASAARWKDFEGDVSEATARLRKSVEKAAG